MFLFLASLYHSHILSFSVVQVQRKWRLCSHQNQIRFIACEIHSWCFAFRSITINVPESKTSTICSIRHRISVALLDLQKKKKKKKLSISKQQFSLKLLLEIRMVKHSLPIKSCTFMISAQVCTFRFAFYHPLPDEEVFSFPF